MTTYRIGDVVRIVDNYSTHSFSIGEEVIINEVEGESEYYASNGSSSCWVGNEDIEIISRPTPQQSKGSLEIEINATPPIKQEVEIGQLRLSHDGFLVMVIDGIEGLSDGLPYNAIILHDPLEDGYLTYKVDSPYRNMDADAILDNYGVVVNGKLTVN